MIPIIDSCLVCDLVRPELGGKLSILGFYGVCPRVDVALQQLDQPTVLTFVFAGGQSEGSFSLVFDVVDAADRIIASTAPQQFEANPKTVTVLAPTLLLVFGNAGQFAARFLVDGQEQFRASFHISQAVTA